MNKLLMILSMFSLLLSSLNGNETQLFLNNWKENTLLKTQVKQPARTAVLIIVPPTLGNCFISNRWRLGQKVWEQYMNIHPNVDCYFLKTTNRREGDETVDQVWIEGNTIYIGDHWYDIYGTDRILHKSIVAMEWLLPKYTHFIRTNVNTFLNLDKVNEFMETHHTSFYTTPLWEGAWYSIGYGIIYTSDVAAHMVSEYRRLEKLENELISPAHADDGALTSLATGVWPYDPVHPFTCCPTLPLGVRQLMDKESLYTKRLSHYGILLSPLTSVDQAKGFCEKGSDAVMLYRTRDGLSLNEIAELYEYLLAKNYPELPFVDLQDFVKTIAN